MSPSLPSFTPNTPLQGSVGGLRRFAKPPESLERSLELSRHRGGRKRTQKRPNYKNLGEEEDEERAGGGGGGGGSGVGEDGWEDGGSRGGEREKGKGTEGGGGGSSKGSRASGETAEGECVCQCRAVLLVWFFLFCLKSHQPDMVHHDAPWSPQQKPSSPNSNREFSFFAVNSVWRRISLKLEFFSLQEKRRQEKHSRKK